jgi:hypothetical protein
MDYRLQTGRWAFSRLVLSDGGSVSTFKIYLYPIFHLLSTARLGRALTGERWGII